MNIALAHENDSVASTLTRPSHDHSSHHRFTRAVLLVMLAFSSKHILAIAEQEIIIFTIFFIIQRGLFIVQEHRSLNNY